MVAPGAEFRGDTRSGISWCHFLSCDASAAMTDLGGNYVQMRMETKKSCSPKIRGFFSSNAVGDQ